MNIDRYQWINDEHGNRIKKIDIDIDKVEGEIKKNDDDGHTNESVRETERWSSLSTSF